VKNFINSLNNNEETRGSRESEPAYDESGTVTMNYTPLIMPA